MEATTFSGDALINFVRRKQGVAPSVEVFIKSRRPGSAPNEIEGIVTAGGQDIPFTVLPDGRRVVFPWGLSDITKDPTVEVRSKINLANEPFKGAADARVTIVEYADFQCPFCTRGYATIEDQVLETYGDKVKFYYKHFPLAFHKWAEPAAIAAECAKAQSPRAYWAVYDYYFGNQKDVTEANVKEKAWDVIQPMGLNQAEFNACYADPKTKESVRADMAEGQSVGVTGTPSFVINGRLLIGAQPFEKFKAVIDDELASSR